MLLLEALIYLGDGVLFTLFLLPLTLTSIGSI